MFSFTSAGRVVAAVLACAMSWTLASQPVGAQNYTPIPTPPVVSAVEGNGVDLLSGKMITSAFDVGIGGAGGLSRSEGIFGDSLRGVINGSASTPLTVAINSRSETFNRITGGFVSANGTGNTLSCVGTLCSYTQADGTIAVFDTTIVTVAQFSGIYATLTSISKPDGEVLKFYYKSIQATISMYGQNFLVTVQQPVSVTSSVGWMLEYHYLNDDINSNLVRIEALNTSVDYCDPTQITCPNESQTWPYALIESTGPTDMLGHKTNYVGTLSQPTSIVSPSGVTKTIAYSNNRVQTVSVGSSTWTYTYSTTTLNGVAVSVSSVQDPNNGLRTIVYDASQSQILSDTDPMNRKTSYIYYTTTNTSGAFKGAVSQVIAPDATWNGTTPTGGYAEYAYDGRGNVTSVKTYPKGGGTPLIVTTSYPTAPDACTTNPKTCNKPLTVTDSAGVVTTYTYHSGSGNVATVTLPAPVAGGVAPQTRYDYLPQTPHVKNSPTTFVDSPPVWRLASTSSCMTTASCAGTSDELKTTYTYVGNNILPAQVTVTHGNPVANTVASLTTTSTYDNLGNVIVVDGPKPGAVDEAYYFYDALNRQIGMVTMDPDGNAAGSVKRTASRTTYNTDGQAANQETGTAGNGTVSVYSGATPAARWAQAYSDWHYTGTAGSGMATLQNDTTDYSTTTGLPMVAHHYNNGVQTYLSQTSYDSGFRVSCRAQRLNSSIFNTVSSTAACAPATAGPDGNDRIVKYNYDLDGAVLSTVSAYGTQAARTDVTQVYNSISGTLSSLADGKGNLTTTYYDNFNRPIKTCFPTAANGGTPNMSDCDQTAYLGNGRVDRITLRGGQVVVLGYDLDGRVINKSDTAGTFLESYAFDNFSQIKTLFNSVTGGTSRTETYVYDTAGLLLSDAQPMGTLTYGYDAYGRRTQLTYPGTGLSVTYSYDDGDQLTAIKENGTTNLATYAYDDYGRTTSLTHGNGYLTTVAYDGNARLKDLTNNVSGGNNKVSLGYSAADQITSRTNSNAAYAWTTPTADKTTPYGTDGLNRLTSSGASSMTYDARGNMTSDGAVTYGYTINNLLVSASNGVSLTYDASNRLLSYTAGSPAATTRFLYDGADLIAEYDGSVAPVLLRRYVHGPGTDNPLVWYEGSGTTDKRYLLADERGSITAVTNGAGVVQAINTYDDYGIPSTTNGAYASRFRYTGQIWLQELSFYNYKARLYAPSLGRFLQTDPIGYGDGMNWYAYAHNDPMNGTDPTGLYTGWGPVYYIGNGCTAQPFNTPQQQTVTENSDGSATITGGLNQSWYVICNTSPYDAGDFGRNPYHVGGSNIIEQRNGKREDCPIMAPPKGRYHAHGNDVRFEPGAAERFGNMISDLNDQNYEPTFTSGFRTFSEQSRLYNAWVARGKTGNPVAVPGTSFHEVARAGDFGPNNNKGMRKELRQAGTDEGLNNDAPSRDKVHYQNGFGHVDPAQVAACNHNHPSGN